MGTSLGQVPVPDTISFLSFLKFQNLVVFCPVPEFVPVSVPVSVSVQPSWIMMDHMKCVILIRILYSFAGFRV